VLGWPEPIVAGFGCGPDGTNLECEGQSTSNKGTSVKAHLLGSVSILLIGLTGLVGLAAPANAAQHVATKDQKAVAALVYEAFQASLAADPTSFDKICELYASSPKKVLALFMAEQDIKDSVKLLGATTKDFRVGTNIALKKVCA